MAYPSPRRLQLRRGNASAVSSYLGYAGELVVDTTNWTLYVHDGVTVGGYAATTNTASINGNISSILNGTAVFGNIIPSANAVYSLGNITHQWKSLFVSNSTIYVGGVPLSIDATGNLTVNGNTIPTIGYVNTVVANVTVDLSSYALNANVTAANVGLKGYVDQANSIQSAVITSANIAMKGYVDQQITDLIGGAPSVLDTLNEIAASINDDANVYTSLINSIATANTALKGYVDQANTIQSAQLTSANLGIIGYIDQANTIQSQQLSAANIGIIGYIDQANSIQSVVITEANVGMKGYVDSIAYGNAEVKTYLATEPGDYQRLIQGYYANLDLGATAELYSFGGTSKSYFGHDGYQGDPGISTVIADNYFIKISTYNGAYNWTFDNTGNLTLPGNVAAINYANGSPVSFSGGSNYSNVQVATYLPTYTGTLAGGTLNLAGQDGTTVADFQTGAATNQIITLGSNYTFSIKAGDGASNRGSLVLESGRNSRVRVNGNGSNVLITAGNGTQSSTWIFSNSGVLTFPDGTTQSTAGGAGSNYGNVNVKAYTESMGFQNYGNSNVIAYLNATGYNLYSNVNVAAYLSTATINTTGNITAQNLIGNISITGNVTGTSANVTLQAGSFSSTFDNQGNVTLPTAYVTGNVTANYFIGNGALLTGIAASSNYSNVNVATYLPTYSGNIANIRLGVSGVLTFADGTTQITAGGGSYSNVQVAAYLTTGVNTAAPQIQLTNATSNYIKYNNVGVGAPTFTTANVGTRIIYWSSVDANTADYAVGIDAGTLWHGIPRATSGFAFKWYGGTTQIAMLEGTGSFTIANIRLSPSGNIVFADGTVQTTAATGTYSNIQVATYLPTYTGSLNASNILVTSANITIANIQATTAATNTATGALRVMGGAGIAGTVFAGQLNTTGNLIANAVSAYSLNTVANVVASVVNAGTINSAGNVLAQNIIGTIATASQTGITAVGTLATLSVTGNATVGNLIGTEANTRIIANVYTTTFDIYGNVSFPGNVNVGGLGVTMPARPAFRVNGTAAPITTANVNLKGSAITTVFNQGNYLDTTTGKFTAPVAGIYEVLLNARVGSFNGLSQIAVLKNGNNSQGNVVCFWEIGSTSGTANHFGVSGTINLVAGDYLSANILAGNISFDSNDNWCVTYLG